MHILSASASLSVSGVPDAPTAAPTPGTTSGRTFYVDSRIGNDANDGRANAAVGGSGPWKTLARLLQSDLVAGDSVVLACGSEWREPLRLPANGTAALPITVTAPREGCAAATAPAIDGSLALAAGAWSLHAGNIYKTTVGETVLDVTAAAVGLLSEAHHPNRNPSDPQSTYLSLGADGNVVSRTGGQGSTILYGGDDLVLPAGATLPAGTRLRVRSANWWLDELSIASVQGTRFNLNAPTTYAVTAGRGYLLLGQLWMLDSPGEWHFDAATKTLYVWAPDSLPPAARLRATVLPMAVDLRQRENVVVQGLSLRRAGLGVAMQNSKNVQLRNVSLSDIVGKGADASGSTAAVFESNVFSQIGDDAIAGQTDTSSVAVGMTVRNNVVRDIGVRMDGDTVVSLPRPARAAIRTGRDATVTANVVVDAGFIGIWAAAGSTVENNFVYGACSTLDDCGGIYTSGAGNNGRIRNNTVVHSRGNVAGKPAAERYTQAQGIYLDESASGVLVEGNTVVDADKGIQLHVANSNIVRGNRLYGNRDAQLWLHETRNRNRATGDVWGNVVEDNQLAPTRPGAVGILLQTLNASTAHFGSFDRNRYYDRAPMVVARTATAVAKRDYSLAEWQSGNDPAAPLRPDANGASVSTGPFAALQISGGSIVPNPTFADAGAKWTHWNQTAPAGQLTRESCAPGTCLRYVAGGSPGIVSSPNFSVRQGQWYRFSVDLATQRDNQQVQIVVRRGGGGSTGYESLSSTSLAVTAGQAWRRHAGLFQATQTINVRDPATGDLGARVDIQGIAADGWVSLANMEVMPVALDALSYLSSAVVNAGAQAISASCPLASTQPQMCSKFRLLATDQPVSWPLTVPAYSAVIVYAQEPTLVDSDRDGIPDGQDSCPATAAGSAVNGTGCSIALR